MVADEIHDTTIRAIFGSNMIERAGLGWDITASLCREVFAGNSISDIPEEGAIDSYREQQPDLKNQSDRDISRARSEVIQHAKAYEHLVRAFVIEQRDLSEDLIKETHKILTRGVPIIQHGFPDIQPGEYGGIYRKVAVAAGNTNFTVPKFVPAKMKEMCEELCQELATAEEGASSIPSPSRPSTR